MRHAIWKRPEQRSRSSKRGIVAGGRVLTIRDGFAAGQHAEAGADLIDAEQTSLFDLAKQLKLPMVRILRAGWGFYGENGRGRRTMRTAPRTFEEAGKRLRPEIADYELAEKRWDSAIAARLARTSVSTWLKSIDANGGLAAGLRGLRGFFLADPEDLSLLVLVDQFASGDTPGEGRMFRIRGGNDRLPRALADNLHGRFLINAVVRRIQRRENGVVVTIDDRQIAARDRRRLLRRDPARDNAKGRRVRTGSA